MLTSVLIFLFTGKYHKEFKIWSTIKMLLFALLGMVLVYSLLPNDFRFSRAVLLMGGVLGAVVILVVDLLTNRLVEQRSVSPVNVAIVGERHRTEELLALLDQKGGYSLAGFVHPTRNFDQQSDYLGDLDSIDSVIRFHRIKELIFNQNEVSTSEIMQVMTTLDQACRYKIYAADTASVIGSYSKEYQGQIDTFDIHYAISSPYQRFMKRLTDIILSIICILFFPVIWPLNRFNMNYFTNVFQTLAGKKTWIGYNVTEMKKVLLPKIKSNILGHSDSNLVSNLNPEQRMHLDFIYAREYQSRIDFNAFFNQMRALSS